MSEDIDRGRIKDVIAYEELPVRLREPGIFTNDGDIRTLFEMLLTKHENVPGLAVFWDGEGDPRYVVEIANPEDPADVGPMAKIAMPFVADLDIESASVYFDTHLVLAAPDEESEAVVPPAENPEAFNSLMTTTISRTSAQVFQQIYTRDDDGSIEWRDVLRAAPVSLEVAAMSSRMFKGISTYIGDPQRFVDTVLDGYEILESLDLKEPLTRKIMLLSLLAMRAPLAFSRKAKALIEDNPSSTAVEAALKAAIAQLDALNGDAA